MLQLTLRRTPLAILLLSLLVLGSFSEASALQQPAPGRRANARKLLRIADGASHRLIQAGQGRLDRDVRARPFWEALLRMNAQIDRIGAGLRTRDVSFFQALRSGTASLAELQVTWALAGVKDPAVDQNLRTLAAAYGRLRNRYGPEWVRFQTGRPLSEDERLRFARMRAEQGLLADRIEPLRDQAERSGDHATADELSLLLVQIRGIASASPTLGDYLDASVATDSIRGAWYGARARHAADEEGWAEADQAVSGITTGEDVGFVFTTDLQEVQDWSFVEEETEISEEIARSEEREASREAETSEAVEVPEVVILDEEPVEGGEVWGEEPAEPVEPLEETPEELPEEEGEVVETTLEEVEGLEDVEATEELAPEAVPGDETFEEEDLDIEVPPAGAEPPPADPSPTSPPIAPAGLPIG